MAFEIHSDITNRSMTIASRAMRRVLRRKRSIMWAIFGWSVFFINALLLIPFDGEPFTLFSECIKRTGSYEFDIPYNRQQLADYLNVERSALSNELSLMQRDGLIRYEKNHFAVTEQLRQR